MSIKDVLNGSMQQPPPFALVSMVMGTEQGCNVCMAMIKTQPHPPIPQVKNPFTKLNVPRAQKLYTMKPYQTSAPLEKGKGKPGVAVAHAWQENATVLHPKKSNLNTRGIPCAVDVHKGHMYSGEGKRRERKNAGKRAVAKRKERLLQTRTTHALNTRDTPMGTVVPPGRPYLHHTPSTRERMRGRRAADAHANHQAHHPHHAQARHTTRHPDGAAGGRTPSPRTLLTRLPGRCPRRQWCVSAHPSTTAPPHPPTRGGGTGALRGRGAHTPL